MKKLIIILVIFLNIQTSSFAQWQPCQGLEGGSVGNIIQSDSFLFVSSSNNIYRTDTNFLSLWEISKSQGSGTLLKIDSCIFSYGIMRSPFRSCDNGTTWSHLGNIGSPYSMCYINNTIFLDYYGFIAKSNDYLDTFEIINYLPQMELPFLFSYDSLLFVYDYDSDSIYQSVDTANSWNTITDNGLQSGLWINNMICFNNTIWICGNFGMYFLNMDRTNWIDAKLNLAEEIQVSDLLIWDGELFCGTKTEGIFYLDLIDSIWVHMENSPLNVNALNVINNKLYCGTTLGPYSLDVNGHWQNNFKGLYHRDISSLCALNDTIYVFANNELFKSLNNGLNFEKISDINGEQIIVTDSVLYVLSESEILISRDNAQSWDTITAGLEGNMYHLEISSAFYYILTSKGMYRSEVDSIEWIELTNGINNNYISSIEVIDSVVIIYEYLNDAIFISKDYGDNFSKLFSTESYSVVYEIDSTFYLLLKDTIKYSEDLGTSWNQIMPKPPGFNLYCIDVKDENIFASGSNVINPYLSISYDYGDTWNNIVDNIPVENYPYLKFAKIQNEILLVSSSKNSLWYRDDILTEIFENDFSKEKIDKIHLYPNPVKDVITVELSSIQENCQFRIFDIRGSEQIHGKITGIKTKINLNKLKAGIYIIEVINASEKINQKIIKY